ncbi:hypothetical protein ABQF35_15115 [Mycobacterium syngnathidarum]
MGAPTRSDIEAWADTVDELTDFADAYGAAAAKLETATDAHVQQLSMPGGTEWDGAAADAAQAASYADRKTVYEAADLMREMQKAVNKGAGDISLARHLALDAINDAEADDFRVGDDLTVADLRRYTSQQASLYETRKTTAEQHHNYIAMRARALTSEDAQLGVKLEAAASALHDMIPPAWNAPNDTTIQSVEFKQGPIGQPEDEANRRQNQIEAFKQVYGREPTSASDWKTASVLDPHSYSAMSRGVPPEIRVVEIRPVPGQGVVRSSQWIEQRDVLSGAGKRDFGNNRGPDAHFDPEDTKVTTYIDYENGLVVIRQNPSVELNPDGGPGEVAIRSPEGNVTQTSDGAVRVRFDAANPFAPDIAKSPPGPIADHAWTVNGDLVFTPGSDGVRVDGTRTDYPSMEVYQDLPDASTRTVIIDPADSGRSWGPIANLPYHHEVGMGGRAFAPFDSGGWNPRYDVPVPLPSTEFGPVDSPPSIPQTRAPSGPTQF